MMSLDLLSTKRADAELHPDFLNLRDSPLLAPARSAVTQAASLLDDPDGNFVEQFQTFGFDARTFELYLDALFRAEGHSVDRSHARPDFLITRGGVTVAVEAVTSNPTPTPAFQPYDAVGIGAFRGSDDDLVEHLKNEPQIRMGSPLFSKLGKRYWELPHVRGLPFVLALQPFHEPGSLGLSSTALATYLMGLHHRHRFEDGRLIVEADSVAEHVGSKTIPSNFFGLPGAEHVSGVLFCNAGTIPKFNRIGRQNGHGKGDVRMVRHGTCYDHDPNAIIHAIFAYEVGARRSPVEPWRDGAVMIHNPHALRPVPAEWIGAMSEENLEASGTVVTTWRDQFLPYRSLTTLLPGSAANREVKVAKAVALRRLRLEQMLAANIMNR